LILAVPEKDFRPPVLLKPNIPVSALGGREIRARTASPFPLRASVPGIGKPASTAESPEKHEISKRTGQVIENKQAALFRPAKILFERWVSFGRRIISIGF
jgi:hypothetical protein